MNNSIEEVFNGIPANQILKVANKVRSALKTNPTFIQLKDKKEFVTQADFEIQRCILEYFKTSLLARKYFVKAEEKLSQEEPDQSQSHSNYPYQLVIDPLDGTSEFCKDEETWGSMVGLCGRDGRIIYSWNLLSNGEIFSSGTAKFDRGICDWSTSLRSKDSLRFDIYDYGDSAHKRFPEIFQSKLSASVSLEQIQVTSYKAAVWAGWELYNRRLDGLLWLPSDRGKGSYPDYDLVALGALHEQGWNVSLGKICDAVLMVAIGPSEAETNILWETGISMLPRELASSLVCDRDLRITSSLGTQHV